MDEELLAEIEQIQAERALLANINAIQQERAPAPPAPPSIGDKITNIVKQVNTGIIEAIPAPTSNIQNYLASTGAMYPTGQAPQGGVETAARFAGQAAMFAPVAAEFGVINPAEKLVRQGGGLIRRALQDITEQAALRPTAAAAGELIAGTSAGYAVGETAEAGKGEIAQGFAGLAGGFAPGVAASTIRTPKAMLESFLTTYLPFTEAGAMPRAAAQMQIRAGGSERAADLAALLDAGVPEGIPPAQYLQDLNLLRQQERIFQDNPELRTKVNNAMDEALVLAQSEYNISAGQARTREQWERALIQSVSPEGSTVSGVDTDRMLDSAFSNFSNAYAPAKGKTIEVPENYVDTLTANLNDPELLADTQSIKTVSNWLKGQIAPLNLEQGSVSSDALLTLRTRIRARGRSLRNSNRTNAETMRELFSSLDTQVTQLLESGLEDEARRNLAATDRQYRQYKIVEDAVYRAGDEQLTPQNLSTAIKRSSSVSEYARGVNRQNEILRQFAREGRSTEELIGNPRRASFITRDMDEEGKRTLRSDLLQRLYTNNTDSAGVVDGRALYNNIRQNRDVLLAMGATEDELGNLTAISNRIRAINARSPDAVKRLIEDGASSVLDLVVTVAAARSGQNLADAGAGASIVLAGYMAKRARNMLQRITKNRAEQLLVEAATDPALYSALLTRPTAPRARLIESARTLESWLLSSASAAEAMQDSEQNQ